MTDGIRAELVVHGPTNCPVAQVSAAREEPVTDVTWTRQGDRLVEEFRLGADADNTAAALAEAEPVVDVGDDRVYRFERDADATCACGVVEALGHPLADVRVEDGALVVTLHLDGVESLRDVVEDLEAVADHVEVSYLVHAAADGDGATDRTVVDRGTLTERQREVLRTAHEMGYFEYPRDANATEVAEALDIGISTFAEHLAAAQGKLLDEVKIS